MIGEKEVFRMDNEGLYSPTQKEAKPNYKGSKTKIVEFLKHQWKIITVVATLAGLVWLIVGVYDRGHENGYEEAKKLPLVSATLEKIEAFSKQNIEYEAKLKNYEQENQNLLNRNNELEENNNKLADENQRLVSELETIRANLPKGQSNTKYVPENIQKVNVGSTSYFFNGEIYVSVINVGMSYDKKNPTVSFNAGMLDENTKSRDSEIGDSVSFFNSSFKYEIRVIRIDQQNGYVEFQALKSSR